MEKFTSGDLGDSSLTLRDLELIRKSFVHILEGYFHTRIEYPKLARASAGRDMKTAGASPRRPRPRTPWKSPPRACRAPRGTYPAGGRSARRVLRDAGLFRVAGEHPPLRRRADHGSQPALPRAARHQRTFCRFPEEEGRKGDPVAGDIAISLDALGRNAARFEVSENEEMKRLLVHGLLHLAGMDHGTGPRRGHARPAGKASGFTRVGTRLRGETHVKMNARSLAIAALLAFLLCGRAAPVFARTPAARTSTVPPRRAARTSPSRWRSTRKPSP